MALINIEYGSLASSDTMNKNFLYLEDKILDSNESIMTSISSILSNIATINLRLNDMSQNINDSIDGLQSQFNNNKIQMKNFINNYSLIPDWSNVIEVSIDNNAEYIAPSNGYILLLPLCQASGSLKINGNNVNYKQAYNSYDHASILSAIPILKNDVISCTASMSNIYFLPSISIDIEELENL